MQPSLGEPPAHARLSSLLRDANVTSQRGGGSPGAAPVALSPSVDEIIQRSVKLRAAVLSDVRLLNDSRSVRERLHSLSLTVELIVPALPPLPPDFEIAFADASATLPGLASLARTVVGSVRVVRANASRNVHAMQASLGDRRRAARLLPASVAQVATRLDRAATQELNVMRQLARKVDAWAQRLRSVPSTLDALWVEVASLRGLLLRIQRDASAFPTRVAQCQATARALNSSLEALERELVQQDVQAALVWARKRDAGAHAGGGEEPEPSRGSIVASVLQRRSESIRDVLRQLQQLEQDGATAARRAQALRQRHEQASVDAAAGARRARAALSTMGSVQRLLSAMDVALWQQRALDAAVGCQRVVLEYDALLMAQEAQQHTLAGGVAKALAEQVGTHDRWGCSHACALTALTHARTHTHARRHGMRLLSWSSACKTLSAGAQCCRKSEASSKRLRAKTTHSRNARWMQRPLPRCALCRWGAHARTAAAAIRAWSTKTAAGAQLWASAWRAAPKSQVCVRSSAATAGAGPARLTARRHPAFVPRADCPFWRHAFASPCHTHAARDAVRGAHTPGKQPRAARPRPHRHQHEHCPCAADIPHFVGAIDASERAIECEKMLWELVGAAAGESGGVEYRCAARVLQHGAV